MNLKNKGLVVCVAKNGAIGYKNDLVFRISSDMKFFKELTMDNVIIMGLNTWNSLPKKPLLGRINIVVNHTGDICEGAEYTALTFDDALKYANEKYPFKQHIIMGGAMMYKTFIDNAKAGDYMYINVVDAEPENADTYFPEFNKDEYYLEKDEVVYDEKSGLNTQLHVYIKRGKVFLSMPMSGCEESIKERLDNLKKDVKEKLPYFEIVTQPDLTDIAESKTSHKGNEYNKMLLEDFRLIEECDAVIFANNWEQSKGCRAEWNVAVAFDKPIYYIN